MGSPWLPMGPYSVRMKRTASRKVFKYLPVAPGQVSGPKTIPKANKSPNPMCLFVFLLLWGVGGTGGGSKSAAVCSYRHTYAGVSGDLCKASIL